MKNDGQKNADLRDDIDSFWDISELMPKRRHASAPAPHGLTETVELTVDADRAKRTQASDAPTSVKLPERGNCARRSVGGNDPLTRAAEYSYDTGRALIRHVDVLGWHSEYSYYRQFYRHALSLEHSSGEQVPHVHFFSYMPQYTQLGTDELRFYVWWRDEVRRGICPPADYSYVLLYIYELINLYSGTPRAGTALSQLMLIWKNYRKAYPRLDVQLSEWVCDLCLINGLAPPADELALLGGSPYLSATLREFYVDGASGENAYAAALMAFCSNYDWRKSKYAAGATKLYEKHLPAAVGAALDAMKHDASRGPHMQSTVMIRDAYVGALCTSQAKKRLRIDCFSFSRSHELRFAVTDILKYSENKLRAAMGIRSRLSYGPLPNVARAAVDRYFSERVSCAPPHPATVKKTPVPEYERLYEPSPETNMLSIENAVRIESESWQTTDKLIEAFADVCEDEGHETTLAPTETESADDILHAEAESEAAGQIADDTLAAYREFILAALEGDGARQRELAAEAGKLVDAVADEINEAAIAPIGDVILEDAGGYYTLIADYADDVRALLGS